ncbi:MAG TPA: hypothetical protein VHQ65_09255 [Thermoanaerobaculia bacterium]|nr:hypothetical protein [Thermoanaerobaculia bacterium]
MKRSALLVAAVTLFAAPAAIADSAAAPAPELLAPAVHCAPATADLPQATPAEGVFFLQASENASCTGQCRSQFGQCQSICQRFPCLISCEELLEICFAACAPAPA